MATTLTIKKQAGGYFLFEPVSGLKQGSSKPSADQRGDKLTFYNQKGSIIDITGYGNIAIEADGETFEDFESAEAVMDKLAEVGFFFLNNAGPVALTSEVVETSGSAPYPVLIENAINAIDGNGSVRVPDPANLEIGHVLYTKAGNSYTIRSFEGTSKLSFGGTNSYSSSLAISTPNVTYRLMHLGSGFWQVEYVNGSAPA